MKHRLSIKARVTLWYAIFLAFLLAAILAVLLSVTEQNSSQQLRDSLLNTVSDAVRDVRFDHDRLDGSRVDFYRGGVSIFIYDGHGRLLAPEGSGIQIDSVLEDQAVKIVDVPPERWLIHDVYAEWDGEAFWVRGIVSLSASQGTLSHLIRIAVIGAPVILLLGIAGGWLITRRAFLPVSKMTAAVNRISSGSDLSLRLPEDESGDELAQLRRTFNAMLERLQSSFSRERQFTSDVSHELRTPVAVILSQCEFALSSDADCDDRQESLEAIHRQASRMSGIIAQLLMLSRADNGKFTLHPERINFSEICEMAALELEGSAAEADVTLHMELTPDVFLNGDETLMVRLVTNLLTNAIRYNRPGGRVTIRLSPEEGGCLLAVSDTGIGIHPDNLDKIWNRFFRADPSRSSGGTGLGLPIVQWIVREHGGTISVQSVPNVGTNFEVHLKTDPFSRQKNPETSAADPESGKNF